MRPHPCKAGEEVLKLCEFNLRSGFDRSRMGRKDVEDYTAAIKDLDTEFFLKIPNLRWRELVVEDDHVGRM